MFCARGKGEGGGESALEWGGGTWLFKRLCIKRS